MKDTIDRYDPTDNLEAADTTVDLKQYWYVFKRRLWIFITIFVVVTTLMTLRSIRQTPIYQATATLIIEQEIPLSPTGAWGTRVYIKDFYGTQYQIIRSYAVAERTVKLLGMKEDKSAIQGLRGRISVSPIEDSSLVRVSISHPDPKEALRQVEALARAYIGHNLEDRQSASRDTFSWLSEQLAILKAKVSQSEMELLKFKEQEDIVSLEKRQILLEEKLSGTQERHNQIVEKNMELNTLLTEMQKISKNPEMAESLPRIVENTLIQSLKTEYSQLEGEAARISRKLKPKHPQIVSMRLQIDSVKQRLAAEVGKIVKSIEIEYEIGKTNEKAVKQNLDELKHESMRLAQQAIQYGVLKRESETNKQMYDVMLQRLKETDISGSITPNNIRIIDPAELPRNPISPNRRRDITVAIFLGLGIGLGLVYFVEYTDNTIKSEEDVRVYLKQDVLGLTLMEKKSKIENIEDSERLARSYGAVKTLLNLYRREHVLKTMLVTSSVRAEGKSMSVAMLGRVLAQSGVKVLLIDADLFRPSLGKILKISTREGLSDVLSSGRPEEELIVESGTPNLWILPSGLIPKNPAEMIESEKIRQLVQRQKDNYDIIIFDTPPLTASFEVAMLCSFVDGVVFNVKANHTPRSLVRKTMDRLRAIKPNILGVLVTFAKQDYGEGYYYKYYYKYYRDYTQAGEKMPDELSQNQKI
jgi:capsular exopolysaccharide synthesis family protein